MDNTKYKIIDVETHGVVENLTLKAAIAHIKKQDKKVNLRTVPMYYDTEEIINERGFKNEEKESLDVK